MTEAALPYVLAFSQRALMAFNRQQQIQRQQMLQKEDVKLDGRSVVVHRRDRIAATAATATNNFHTLAQTVANPVVGRLMTTPVAKRSILSFLAV